MKIYPKVPSWVSETLGFSQWQTEEELQDKCKQVRETMDKRLEINQPSLSYVLPALNEETKILGTLLTLAKQTAEQINFLVIDNNSQDRTKMIAQECGFPVITEKEQRISIARQTGLENVTGKIYAAVDADTIYPVSHAQTIIEAYQEDPELTVTGGEFVFYYKKYQAALYSALANLIRNRNGVITSYGTANASYLRDLLIEKGGFRKDFIRGADREAFLKMKECGNHQYLGEGGRVYTSGRRLENKQIKQNLQHLMTGILLRTARISNVSFFDKNRSLNISPIEEKCFQNIDYPNIR